MCLGCEDECVCFLRYKSIPLLGSPSPRSAPHSRCPTSSFVLSQATLPPAGFLRPNQASQTDHLAPFVTRCPPAPSRPPTPSYLPHIFWWPCLWHAGQHQHTVLLRWALSTTKWPRWLERGPVDSCANPRAGSKRRHAEWGKVGASRTCQGDPELTRPPWGSVRPCCRPFSLGTSDRAAVQSGSQGHLHPRPQVLPLLRCLPWAQLALLGGPIARGPTAQGSIHLRKLSPHPGGARPCPPHP